MIAMWAPGPWEMVIILIIALLIFGKRIPDVGRSLGRGIRQFKDGLRDADKEDDARIEVTGKGSPAPLPEGKGPPPVQPRGSDWERGDRPAPRS